MDIQLLLFLQNLRESLPPFVESVFVAISAFVLSPLMLLIPCIVYWCVNRRVGTLTVFSFSLGVLCTSLVKCIACVYRPWIRSGDIRPSEAALPEATGYSFPSGHTQAATSIIGGIGYHFRRESKAVFVISWVLVVLVGFSRNFLGVHTPQDVLVGLCVGIGSIYGSIALLDWLEAHEGSESVFVAVCTIVTVAFSAFALLKPYPADMVDGKLLVDPQGMKNDCINSAAMAYGAMLGWFCERKTVRFEQTGDLKTRVIRVLIGAVVVLALRQGATAPLKPVLDPLWYEAAKNFLTTYAAVFVAPLAFVAIERHRAR